jgi:hypothetical protein
VTSSLESRIDDLYRLPLREFVGARNALAKSLGGADALRVRKLPKPAVVPWAINQVYWRARPIHDRVMKSGEQLRRAQVAALEGRGTAKAAGSTDSDLRAATAAHRRALADAAREAERFAAEEGSHPAGQRLNEVMRTFEALTLASQPVEAPGRLTRPLQPAGFEALTGVAVKPPGPAQSLTEKKSGTTHDHRAAKKEEAARKKREADLKKAEAAVERARRRMLEAQEALKRTRDQAS